MTQTFVITGTDTDVGKTFFAAALTNALDATYWKPIQAGMAGETDSDVVARLTGTDSSRILPERWCLKTPASPHYAAAQEGVKITTDDLSPPNIDGALVIEGAGGALVPINDDLLFADLFRIWNLPVIIVASTQLGTINHSLLTVEALRQRGVPIHGIAFNGEENQDSQDIICRIGRVAQLGRLPILDHVSPDLLRAAFAKHFDITDFTS